MTARKARLILLIFSFSTFLTFFVNYRGAGVSRTVRQNSQKSVQDSFYIEDDNNYDGGMGFTSRPGFTSPLKYRLARRRPAGGYKDKDKDLAEDEDLSALAAVPGGAVDGNDNSYSNEVVVVEDIGGGAEGTNDPSYAVTSALVESVDDNLVLSQTMSAPQRNNSIRCTISTQHIRETQTFQRASFTIVVNFIKGSREVKCDESITYSTHGDFRFLDNLVPLVERWEGPISIALYIPLADLQPTIAAITYLRECTSPLIKEWVTFHLFADRRFFSDPMPYLKYINTAAGKHPELCTKIPRFGDNVDNERTRGRLLYPVNVARNVARQAAMTHYVLASDIELYPSLHIIPWFLDMLSRNESTALHRPNPRIFTLPVFEVIAEAQLPDTKYELVNMIRHKQAFSFHRRLCSPCHRIPHYFRWLKSNTNQNEALDVFKATKRQDRYKRWEPIFIGTNDEPAFDERLSWEGQKDKMTQNYILCMMDYDYMILDNAFLVHKPGIKAPKPQKPKPDRAVRKQDRIYKKIATELDKVYKKKDGCEL